MLKIFDKLEKNICRIFIDNKGNGTGFFISNRFIITNSHVVSKNADIKVKFYNDENLYKVTLVKIDSKYQKLDIAFLKVQKEVSFYEYIKIDNRELKREEKWITRGYPSVKSGRAEEMRNEKHVIHYHLEELDDEGFDIELNFDTSKWSSYRGLSGSPIVVNNCIVGIITNQQIEEKSKELYGLSTKYFKELIDEIIKEEQNKNEITETISLKNGKSFDIKLVKVELDDNRTIYVGKYPVTFEEYDWFCDDINKIERPKPYKYKFPRENYPVVNVNWIEAKEYCKWLTNKNNKFYYRLPTVIEWEYIAKKNMLEKNHYEYIWKRSNTKEIQRIGYRIGSLGIFDMYGNIYQWCSDIVKNKYRAIRGSSFDDTTKEELTTINLPESTLKELGFRIICEKAKIKKNNI